MGSRKALQPARPSSAPGRGSLGFRGWAVPFQPRSSRGRGCQCSCSKGTAPTPPRDPAGLVLGCPIRGAAQPRDVPRTLSSGPSRMVLLMCHIFCISFLIPPSLEPFLGMSSSPARAKFRPALSCLLFCLPSFPLSCCPSFPLSCPGGLCTVPGLVSALQGPTAKGQGWSWARAMWGTGTGSGTLVWSTRVCTLL